MILRVAKTSLVFGLALLYTLVVLNNIADYNINYQFVRHTLLMDTTFPDNREMWRALTAPAWSAVFFAAIVLWQAAGAALLWWGGAQMVRALSGSAAKFARAKNAATAGLALTALLWLVAFLAVGGEWFLMWQSKSWNGQGVAFHMFSVTGIVLLLAGLPEAELPTEKMSE